MRILDSYILKRFLLNFFSSFAVLMLIFIFQTIWLFIDDFAGKGLDIVIIGKFLFYLMPNLTEKVLPLTVLLSSILTFGTFAENYEFAAMKASGISLQRSMRSLIFFVTILGGVTFYFANNIIPASEQKIYNLRRNIATVKPAAVIEEGVFSDFEGMNIKVDNKHGENDRFLDNVIIHKKSNLQKNNTVIKAKSGELISSEGSEIISLVLKDGHYYEDIVPKNKENKRNFPFARSNFETYTINIEVPENDQDLEEERNVRTDKMKNISRLIKDIDSLKRNNLQVVRAFSKNISNRMGAFVPLFPKDTTVLKKSNETATDSLLNSATVVPRPEATDTNKVQSPAAAPDTLALFTDTAKVDDILDLYQEWQRLQMYNSANNAVSTILTSVRGKKDELDRRYKIYNMHILSLHKKYALAFSCIILFFVGAPLGAIIRKGGLGLPMVIAIVLFLAYYFLGVFAGNYAKEGNIHPILGAWLSTLIMLPLGVFLTRKATADRGLTSFGHISEFFGRLFGKKDEETEEEDLNNEIENLIFDVDDPNYGQLNGYSEPQLLDVVKNYKQYGYDNHYRSLALKVLSNRGISPEELRLRGALSNTKYEGAAEALKRFRYLSDWAFAMYLYNVFSYILNFVFGSDNLITNIFLVINLVSLLLFIYFLVKSFIQYYRFYRILDKKEELHPIIFIIGGATLYFIVYFYSKRGMKTQLNNVR